MQKHAKQLLRSLCCLSIAVACGVAALSPTCAFAGENFVVTLGQYNVYQTGVSDQVPVSVKLKWPGHTNDPVSVFYTAYDVNNTMYWNTSTNITLNDQQTWQNGAVVPATGNTPAAFYVEAQGSNGGDQIQVTQLSTFFAQGPFQFVTPVAVGQDKYEVVLTAVSTQATNLTLNFGAATTVGAVNTPLTTDPTTTGALALVADVPQIVKVKVPLDQDANHNPLSLDHGPVILTVTDPAGALTVAPYQLGTPVESVDNDAQTLTLDVGPTYHKGKWKVSLASNPAGTATLATVDHAHAGVDHQHVKVFFSAQDQSGHGKSLQCHPSVVKELTFTHGAGDTGTLTDSNGQPLGPVAIHTTDPIEGRVQLFAIMALYDNGAGNGTPASFIEPPSILALGP
jgi:hypothetical protein